MIRTFSLSPLPVPPLRSACARAYRLVALSCLLLPLSSGAQEAPPPASASPLRAAPSPQTAPAAPQTTSPPSLEPLVITATRVEMPPFEVPASISSVDGDDLREAHLQVNLAEGLQGVPGLVVRDRENYAQDQQISIRGFGAHTSFGVSGVRVYVDGIPATLPDGQGQITSIDLGSADRIEILRGPSSVLYGNSSGGVVSIFTRDPSGPPSITTTLTGGSFGEIREGVEAQGEAGPLGFVIDGSHFQTAGYRDHSSAERDLVNAKITVALDPDSRLTLILNNVEQGKALDPLGLTRAEYLANPRAVDPAALEFNTRKTVSQSQAGLMYERRVDSADKLTVMTYTGQRNVEQYQAIPVATQKSPLSPGGVIVLDRSYEGVDLRWTRTANLGSLPYSFVAGVTYDTLDEHRSGYNNFLGDDLGVLGKLRLNETNNVSNFDQYMEGSLHLSDNWDASLGVRNSLVQFSSVDDLILPHEESGSGEKSFSAVLPVASLLYSPLDNLRLYATAGRGFETPTLDEIAYRPNGTAGLNFALQPAHSDNYEIGAKSRGTPLGDVTAAAFVIDTVNEIVTQTNTAGRSTYENAGATRREGLELGALQHYASYWQTQISYTYLDAYYRDSFLTCATVPCATPKVVIDAGNRLPGIARGTLYGELAWAPPQGWRAGIEARVLTQVYANDSNRASAAGYAIASARIGYNLHFGKVPVTTFLRVDNLFDRKYVGSVIVDETSSRFYEPGFGRSVLAGVSATFS
ncbi:MAG: TonB-dependent receptor [Burkholderiaceae bacterium]